MYSFQEIREMEKAKTADMYRIKAQYPIQRLNSKRLKGASPSKTVPEEREILPVRNILLMQRFFLLLKARFERILLFQNKHAYSWRRN